MPIFSKIIGDVLGIYLFVLFARLILDYARMFSPSWRPRGIILAFASLVFTLTDKPLTFIRRFVPPLRLGAVSLDLSFLVLFFGIQLIRNFLP